MMPTINQATDDQDNPQQHARKQDKPSDIGQKCVCTRWVCTLKETPDGMVPKARLVRKRFRELNTKDLPKDLPTCDSLISLITAICKKQ